jgi:hypothetical protein
LDFAVAFFISFRSRFRCGYVFRVDSRVHLPFQCFFFGSSYVCAVLLEVSHELDSSRSNSAWYCSKELGAYILHVDSSRPSSC